MAYIFFDQNVIERLSKKQHESFQNNVNRFLEIYEDPQQLLTPFSLLEFSGYNLKEVLNIQYEGRRLPEYPFQSYNEFDNNNLIEYIKKQTCKTITKPNLREKLEKKLSRESEYLNEKGVLFINDYIEKIDLMYEDLINNLFWDQLSQINTSRFSPEDKVKYIMLCTCFVLSSICKKTLIGSLRTVYKLYDELRKKPITEQIKRNPKLYETQKEIPNILENRSLKSKGDLVDCELPHLAFFGFNSRQKHDICHIYTTDSESTITNRMKLYCALVKNVISFIFDSKHYSDYIKHNDKCLWNDIENNRRPEWKFGKVFILNQETGEKIKEISVTKTYEEKNGTIQ